MHPHKNGEPCQDCFGAALASASNHVDTISSYSFDISSPREALELPCDSIRRGSRHIDNHAQITAPASGISLNELATRVYGFLHASEPVQIKDSLESGLYKLARRLPIASRLVVQVARNEASWSEFEALKRIFEGSHEYLAAASPSLLPPTIVSGPQSSGDASGPAYTCIDSANEMVQVFGRPEELPKDRLSHRPPARETPNIPSSQGLSSDDNIASPFGGRVDHHHNVLPAEDSGYGSIAENVFVFVPRPKEGAGDTVEVNEDESETPYSIATNEDPAVTRGFVDELARDIYRRLKPMMDPDDWPLISESLLKLLKAFAITIGSDGASQANPDVMYFIHKQHRNIAREVRNLLLCQDDDTETHSRVDTEMDTMSLLDKMDMWDQKLSIEESRPKSPELFQNVTDDEFNMDVSFMDNKMILDSKDYDCFIQSLKTELLLDRYETDPSSSDMAIRQQILSTLPAGKISKRRRPKNHFVVFRFPTPSSTCLMNDRVVVTSSSRNLQLTRISTYVDQTWPLLGRQVLRLVLFQGSKFQDRAFVHLAKNTQAFVTFGESYSSVSLIGSAYSAGEVGELLAWLAAATSDLPSSNDSHHVIVTTPSITKLGNFIELSQKSKGTTEEQWYAIWDILFPSESRPLSIYIDSEQSEDFVGLREFSQREGLSILHDRIRATGQILRPDVSEQTVRDTLRHALDSLFEYYRMNEALGRAEPLQTGSRTSSDSRPQGVTDNDSGVMLASHSPHGSHTNRLAIAAISENNNEGTPVIEAIDSTVQPQVDRVDPLQPLEAFNADMSEDWGMNYWLKRHFLQKCHKSKTKYCVNYVSRSEKAPCEALLCSWL
ncbi:hypothetical protein CEP54_013377 [Fusarium duplospermum]|uniref:Uncharacterized protein n=1 Tax=Fusarium duplospermum TaxID=1325734 RepID=A0A428P391_9HYPO|nr:hypothetical protein CEP54_013377 [Fusarium duplospermum]